MTTWRERIVVDLVAWPPEWVVRGTRLAATYLARLLAEGRSPLEITQCHPGVSLEDVEACRRFAAERARGAGGEGGRE